jgi:SsrA-binding protein
MSKKPKASPDTIVLNKKARHDYFIEDSLEAGLVLTGWEVKALRAGRVQLVDSYVIFKDGEAWLLGAMITPLQTASTHFVTDPQRTRKLLMQKRQLAYLMGAVQQKGYTCLCLKLYWKNHLIKAEIALAKGKQLHDKRDTDRERDWNLEKQRVMRHSTRAGSDD